MKKIQKLAFMVVVGVAALSGGCGDDGDSNGGAGGDAGSGGTAGAGGIGGTGGTGGIDPNDPCLGQPACIVCPQEALPPDVAPLLPEGLRVPVDFTATPEGEVVQGATVSIAIDAEIVVALPVPAEGTINEGSTSTYVATVGGDGAADVIIPEQELSGQDLVIDGGTGSGELTVDANATDLVVGLDSVLVDLSVTDPAELELVLDASPSGDCSIEGEGVIIPVTPADI